MADDGWGDRRLVRAMAALADKAWRSAEPNIAGLTDDEYQWGPAPVCWGIRRRDETPTPNAWGRGDLVVEMDLTLARDPSAPPATIGWRLLHAYDCLHDYTSRAFGLGRRDWNDIEVPAHATDAVALMTAAFTEVRDLLAAAPDDTVLAEVEARSGRARWEMLCAGLHEAIHHCAEIGALRAARAGLGR